MTDLRFASALEAHQAGDLNTAKKRYEDLLSEQPEHADASHLLGMLHAQQGDFATAIVWIEKAIQLDAQQPVYWNNLGNAYKATKNYLDAERAYQRAIDLKPNYAEAYNNLGTLHDAQGNFSQALKAYRAALQSNPEYVEAHHNLGLLFLKQEKIAEAITQFKNVVALNPQAMKAHYQLANLYLQNNELDLAKQQYHLVLAADPENVDCLNNLGVIALKRQEPQNALDLFSKALAIDIENLDARNNMAATFMQYSRYENALRHYEEYIKAKPDDVEAHYNMGVANMAMGNLTLARNHYEEVRRLAPNHIDALINLGAIALKLKNRDEAKHFFSEVLARDPENTTVLHMLSALTGENAVTQAPKAYVKNLFDNYAGQYDQHLKGILQYQLPAAIKSLFTTIYGSETHDLIILDIGCGTGLIGEAIKPWSSQLIGIDISEGMIEIAQQKAIYDALFTGDAVAILKHEQLHVDVAIAAEVLSYIGDLDEMFEATSNSLSKGGRFCFSIEESTTKDVFLQETIRYAHSQSYIAELAEKYDFKIETIEQVAARKHEDDELAMLIYVLRRT